MDVTLARDISRMANQPILEQQVRAAHCAAPTRIIMLLWLSLFLTPTCLQAQPAQSGTIPFILDGNRVYASVHFMLPDGKSRAALVFVDLGSPAMILSKELYEALELDTHKALELRIGEMKVNVNSDDIASNSWLPFSIAKDRKVEGVLPAGVLQKYQVRFDYAQRTMTLAQPATLTLRGTAVPFQLNPKTGLIAVEATIDGKLYPMTVDNGSGYTWIRKAVAQDWFLRHPDWLRGIGAVGPSNMRMAEDGVETSGALVRMTEVKLGSLHLADVGALAIAPDNSGHDFMDWYSGKNALPVIGWLGGNVLRHFKITLDYPHKISYWERQSTLDPHDLDYIGLTLISRHGEYFVGGIATRAGLPTVVGAQVGDKVVQIGTLPMQGVSWEAIFEAMHGKAGERRMLVLERAGGRIQLQAPVTAF